MQSRVVTKMISVKEGQGLVSTKFLLCVACLTVIGCWLCSLILRAPELFLRCSFYLHPYDGTSLQILTQGKLSAPRILRIHKVCSFGVCFGRPFIALYVMPMELDFCAYHMVVVL